MVGLGNSIAHTSASMSYGWNQEKDAKVVFRQYLAGQNPKEISDEFKIIQSMNENCRKNTLSFVLSPIIEEGRNFKRKDFNQICSEFIKQMNLTDNQAIAFVHNDKAHMHIHLYVNRIDFSGKAYDDSYIGKKSQHKAAIVAKSLGLTTVREVQERKMDATKQIRNKIKSTHEHVLNTERPESFKEYINKMNSYGVHVIPSINKTKQIQGFRFEFEGQNFKGSEVHRSSMSGSKIAASLLAIKKEKEISRNEKNRRSSGHSY